MVFFSLPGIRASKLATTLVFLIKIYSHTILRYITSSQSLNILMNMRQWMFNQPNKYKIFNEESVSRGCLVSWILFFRPMCEFPGHPRTMHADKVKPFFQAWSATSWRLISGCWAVCDTLSNHETEKARSSFHTRRHMVTDDLYFLGKHKRGLSLGLFSDVSFNVYHIAASGLMINYQ
jgi:hypothetical protein